MSAEKSTSKAESEGARAWLVIASLALSMLLASLGISIANVALPSISRDFATSFQWVQWVILSYLMAITIFIVAAGRLGDLLGRRRILLNGIAVFSLGSVLCGLAPTLSTLVLARVIQGLGASVLMALTIAMVRDAVPQHRVGRAMGMLGSTSAIGTAIGPTLGGFILAGPGWRAVFFVLLPLGALSWVMVRLSLPASAAKPGLSWKSFDPVGTTVLALALAAYSFAMTLGGGAFTSLNTALLSLAVIGAIGFVFVERWVESPLVKLDRISGKDPLLAHLLMNIIVAAVMMSTLVVGPFFLAQSLGLSTVQLGLVMAIGPVISIFSGVPSGQLVDRFGAGQILLLGVIAMTLGAFGLAFLPIVFGLLGYVAAIIILTPGYQLFQAANNTAVTAKASAEERGVFSGLLSLSRNLGLVTGASVLGAVFAYGTQSREIATASASAVNNGMQATFLVAGFALLLALALALRASRVIGRNTKPSPASAITASSAGNRAGK